MALDRRNFMKTAGLSIAMAGATLSCNSRPKKDANGEQRLGLSQLQSWEKRHYGMFIHFGMSTFLGQELPDGKASAKTYAPSKLDVDQWVSVARDAGMKYAVLTTKHVAGHCLWPTQHTDYSVKNSSDTTDVVEAFVTACAKRGIKPGFYYCSWDNHNRFGSQTPSDGGPWAGMMSFPKEKADKLPPFTTSLYHHFQTAQITELLTQYGPIFETWIDIPGVLGKGYRTFLYNHIAKLQPETVIMMNSGFGDGGEYNADYAYPSDLIAIERYRPIPDFTPWRTVYGKKIYMPGEHCDPIGKEWFHVPGDLPRSDEELLKQFEQTKTAGVNFLLNVPPTQEGVIPSEYIKSLNTLRQNAKI